MNTDDLQKKKTPQCQGAKFNRKFDEEIRNTSSPFPPSFFLINNDNEINRE